MQNLILVLIDYKIVYSCINYLSFFGGWGVVGRKGRYIESAGLQIAYLSGIEGPGERGEAHTFGSQDVSDLMSPVVNDSRYKGVDILLTCQWPKGVDKYATSLVN